MFDRGISCGTADLEWMRENRSEETHKRGGDLIETWFGDGASRPLEDNSGETDLDTSVQASDIEDTVKRYRGIRGSITGHAGQPHDYLDPGQPATDPNETIHEAVNDTEWWLK